jgi:N-acyl homoserine lactone hydrolase
MAQGLTPADVDVIFVGHLHFDHAGGVKELRRCGCGAEIHLQFDERDAAATGEDSAVWIELPKGPPVLLAGDAADLQENINDEIAPGGLWQGNEAQAIDSIRKLKALAVETGAWSRWSRPASTACTLK